MEQATQLTLLLSLAVAVVGNLAAPWLLRLLGAQPETMPLALDYLRPLMTFSLFSYLSILYGATLRGVGNTRLAFEAALFQNALNVLFNYGLILGNYGLPELGVQGAAIGTVLSQLLGVAFLLFRLHRGAIRGIRAPVRLRRIDRQVTGELWRIGWPAAMDMVILNAGFMTVVGLVGWYDEVAVAAHAIGLRIQGLAFVPGLAIARAAGAMIGNALGAGDPDEARALVFLSVKVCGGVMASLGLLMILLSGPIVAIFGLEQGTPIADYTIQWVWVLGAGLPIVGVWIALGGMLQGSGHTMASLRINGISTLVVQIPLCWFLGYPMGLGPLGVWLGFPCAFLVKAWLGARAYKKGDWARTGVRLGHSG
jgi:putative MATE family efflux protein